MAVVAHLAETAAHGLFFYFSSVVDAAMAVVTHLATMVAVITTVAVIIAAITSVVVATNSYFQYMGGCLMQPLNFSYILN